MIALVVVIYLMIAFTFMYLILRNFKQYNHIYEPTTEFDVYRTFIICILWPLSGCFGLIRLTAESIANWVNKQ